MDMRERLREAASRFPRLRSRYLYVKLMPEAELFRRRELKWRGAAWQREMEEASALRHSGLYRLDAPLTNDLQPFEGRNFLGYPAGGAIKVAGEPVGWYFGSAVEVDGRRIPSYQATTDLTYNFPLVFERYRPEVVIDVGTARGASSVLFAQLMGGYSDDFEVLTIDIVDPLKGDNSQAFRRALDRYPIRSHVGNAVGVDTIEVVRELIERRSDRRVLVSFDDDHSADHVLNELETYSALLKDGDVILVQDTWDQGLRHAPVSALLAVLRFLRQNDSFILDEDLMNSLKLPSVFVHGLMVKRTSPDK